MDIRSINNANYLSQLLKNDCHIPFRFSISKETKNLQWRDLMGPEKLVLFTKINLEMLFPDIPNVEKIQRLWGGFKELHKLLHSENISGNVALKFCRDAKQWVRDFVEFYQSKHVTPYIHILAHHVSVNMETSYNLHNKVWKN